MRIRGHAHAFTHVHTYMYLDVHIHVHTPTNWVGPEAGRAQARGVAGSEPWASIRDAVWPLSTPGSVVLWFPHPALPSVAPFCLPDPVLPETCPRARSRGGRILPQPLLTRTGHAPCVQQLTTKVHCQWDSQHTGEEGNIPRTSQPHQRGPRQDTQCCCHPCHLRGWT